MPPPPRDVSSVLSKRAPLCGANSREGVFREVTQDFLLGVVITFDKPPLACFRASRAKYGASVQAAANRPIDCVYGHDVCVALRAVVIFTTNIFKYNNIARTAEEREGRVAAINIHRVQELTLDYPISLYIFLRRRLEGKKNLRKYIYIYCLL